MNKLQISVKKTIYNLDYGKELYVLYLRRPLTKKITPALTIGVCKSLSHVQLYTTPWTASRLLCHWGFLGKNAGVGCHFLLQRIFLTQGSNPDLLYCRQILYHLSYREVHVVARASCNLIRLCPYTKGKFKPRDGHTHSGDSI